MPLTPPEPTRPIWSREEFFERYAAKGVRPYERALLEWLLLVITGMLGFGMLVGGLEEPQRTPVVATMLAVYGAGFVAYTVRVVRLHGRSFPERSFVCPRCTTALLHPWKRVVRLYLQHRQRDPETPHPLRFDCPECGLPIVDLRRETDPPRG